MQKEDDKVPKERESEINNILIRSAKAEDKRPLLKIIFDAFIHNLKVFRERLSSIR